MNIGRELQTQIQGRIRHNYEMIEKKLTGSSAHPLHTEGGWSVIVQLPRTRSEDEWLQRLLENERLIVQPGYFFDMPSEPYVVLSLLTPPQDLERGIESLIRTAHSGD